MITTISFANGLDPDAMFLSNFENYIETLILFLIFNSLLIKREYFTIERMIKINTFFHLLLFVNTGLVLIEMFTPYADYFLELYVKNDAEGYRTATNSMGRYMGVFNLPMESGMAYSMGLLTWLYNFTQKKNKKIILEFLLFLAILIGGIASVSKVFLMVGAILFVAVFFMIGSIRNKLIFLFVGIFSLSTLVPLLTGGWRGFRILESQFIKITTNFSIDNITAGRLGSGSGIYSWVLNQDILALIFGNGFTQAGLLHLDSEYMQILYQGGVISLCLYLAILIKLFIRCVSIDSKFYKERILMFSILLLGAITAIGGPMIFMNRVRIFFFIQLFFIYKLTHMVFVRIKTKETAINEPSDGSVITV
ncbi:hypothetical protein [Muriicola sp. Z0-33]|uniref:hypothetical protein n=1 Tax=Muriicola sp. Z0-33 TaxID=2816957 RepID=UPI0022379930|nr:hypothetical protein [Muriicola sp. Z0-33]MCW5516899.1 hypothetical protein [Muriicola sp. Z0-33]